MEGGENYKLKQNRKIYISNPEIVQMHEPRNAVRFFQYELNYNMPYTF